MVEAIRWRNLCSIDCFRRIRIHYFNIYLYLTTGRWRNWFSFYCFYPSNCRTTWRTILGDTFLHYATITGSRITNRNFGRHAMYSVRYRHCQTCEKTTRYCGGLYILLLSWIYILYGRWWILAKNVRFICWHVRLSGGGINGGYCSDICLRTWEVSRVFKF